LAGGNKSGSLKWKKRKEQQVAAAQRAALAKRNRRGNYTPNREERA
jgi:hypothetical protein